MLCRNLIPRLMHQEQHRAAERSEHSSEKTNDNNALRLPHLLPSRAVFANERAADGLLGLLASHADKQTPLMHQSELLRCRQMPRNPRPVKSLEAAASATNSMMLQQSEEHQRRQPSGSISSSDSSCVEGKASQELPLVAFLDRPSKCGSPRLPDGVTSPLWQERSFNEQLDPTASPRHPITSTCRLVQTPPTTSPRRIHNLPSPENIQSLNSHKRRTPPPSSPQDQIDVYKQPRLVRRVSSRWRQELLPRDRAQTRERIMRSLHSHSEGDYETLVLLLASMEEELLHIKTTSSDSYAEQAFELSNLIKHATLER